MKTYIYSTLIHRIANPTPLARTSLPSSFRYEPCFVLYCSRTIGCGSSTSICSSWSSLMCPTSSILRLSSSSLSSTLATYCCLFCSSLSSCTRRRAISSGESFLFWKSLSLSTNICSSLIIFVMPSLHGTINNLFLSIWLWPSWASISPRLLFVCSYSVIWSSLAAAISSGGIFLYLFPTFVLTLACYYRSSFIKVCHVLVHYASRTSKSKMMLAVVTLRVSPFPFRLLILRVPWTSCRSWSPLLSLPPPVQMDCLPSLPPFLQGISSSSLFETVDYYACCLPHHGQQTELSHWRPSHPQCGISSSLSMICSQFNLYLNKHTTPRWKNCHYIYACYSTVCFVLLYVYQFSFINKFITTDAQRDTFKTIGFTRYKGELPASTPILFSAEWSELFNGLFSQLSDHFTIFVVCCFQYICINKGNLMFGKKVYWLDQVVRT